MNNTKKYIITKTWQEKFDEKWFFSKIKINDSFDTIKKHCIYECDECSESNCWIVGEKNNA